MLSKLKQKIQSLLSEEARAAHKIGLTPNIVSAFGFLFSVFSAIAYLISFNQTWFLFVAVSLLLVSGFCDVLDGILARTYDQESVFGGFFDSLLDRYSDSVIFIGIIMGGLCDPFWGLLALIGSLLVSYSKARAESLGIEMVSVGLMERAERLILLIGSSIIAFFWLPALNIGVASLAILANFTVIERAFHVTRILKKK
jgi:archaetidylinositol phosphate synthase